MIFKNCAKVVFSILCHHFLQIYGGIIYFGRISCKNGVLLSQCINSSIDNGRSYTDMNIDISNCVFSRLSEYTGSGGVILVDGGAYNLMISYSVFNNCKASYRGGAIYFLSSDSVLKMVCGFMCSASNYGVFAFLKALNNNTLEYLSLSTCSIHGIGIYLVNMESGNQRYEKTNSSMNNVYQGSGSAFESPITFQSTFCTFSDNIASYGICIFFLSNSGTMSNSNIVHNNSPQDYGVIRVVGGAIKILYCIFDMNQNTLFSFLSSFELSHCFISHDGMTSTGNNNSITKNPTYIFQFFGTHNCVSDDNSLQQTPIRTHQSTLSPSLKNTFSRTYEETVLMTLERTFPRTYDDSRCSVKYSNQKDIIIIFAYSITHTLFLCL